jgi:gamma-F420-2:alpha-L-glutamate ligase
MKVWLLTKRCWEDSWHARKFKEAARELGIECYTVTPGDFDIVVTKEGKSSLFYRGKPIELPDCVVPRTGKAYFFRAVMRHLEHEGVLVLNSGESVNIAADKLATLQHLKMHNIPIPKTLLAKFPFDLNLVKKEFTFPLILKTVSGSSGKGVFLCENQHKLKDSMDLIESSKNSSVNIILQEFIKTSRGRDLRVIVIGGRPYGAMLRLAKRGKFKANYEAGGSVEFYKLNPAIEWLAVESAKILNLDFAGVDILFDGDKYVVCEVNSAPGFEGFISATGINIPKILLEYIQVHLSGMVAK